MVATNRKVSGDANVRLGSDGTGARRMSSDRSRDLKDACSLLADGFEEFDEFIEAYIRQVPLRARDSEARDCDRFLFWLEEQVELTREQRDFITQQQSRYAVEFVALKQRIAHHRFQEMVRGNSSFNGHSASHLSQNIHLNPVHVWATYESHVFLDDEAEVPATVLFYATSSGIATAVIEDAVRRLIRELEQGPQKLRTLVKQTPKSERDALLASIAQLVQLELIALAN